MKSLIFRWSPKIGTWKMIDRIILTIFAVLIIIFVNIVIGSRIDNLFERMNHEDENEQGIEGSQKGSKEDDELSLQCIDCDSIKNH